MEGLELPKSWTLNAAREDDMLFVRAEHATSSSGLDGSLYQEGMGQSADQALYGWPEVWPAMVLCVLHCLKILLIELFGIVKEARPQK